MNRIHCSYHKCLTVFYGRVFRNLYNRLLPCAGRYKHFKSVADDFYENLGNYRVMSINNHALDLTKLGDFRMTRFIRDPRDLVVSGYFYHRRGAEEWCRKPDPKTEDWRRVNGTIPAGLRSGESFSAFLQRVDKDTGLVAEIQFRQKHFESMLIWPLDDPRIKLFRYEDIIQDEKSAIADVCAFYDLSLVERAVAGTLANYFSAKRQSGATPHIRNPSAGQWRNHFSPTVSSYFDKRYSAVQKYYGYL